VTLPPLSAHPGDYLCLLLGLATLTFGGVTLLAAWRTRRWPHTDGRIVSSSVDEAADEDGKPLFQARASYEYQVGSTVYRGDRVSPGPHSFGRLFPSSPEALGGRIEGQTCRVYYDPRAPERSVSSPGPTLSHYAVTIVGALFVVIVLKDLALGTN